MARTKRRGMTKDGEFEFTSKHAPDWSCGNPMCCGGEVGRKGRRRDRKSLKQELRTSPEEASTRQGNKGRK